MYASPSNGLAQCSAVLFVTTIKRVVTCTQGTTVHSRTVVIDQGRTHDEYCNMLFTLRVCNSRASTVASEFAIRNFTSRRQHSVLITEATSL
jgi:hypothetical protein